MCHGLTSQERDAAWALSFRVSLDALPNNEIKFEADFWRANGAERVAAIADALLAERGRHDFFLPGNASPAGLTLLIARNHWPAVWRLVEVEALPVIAASRLAFHVGLAETSR